MHAVFGRFDDEKGEAEQGAQGEPGARGFARATADGRDGQRDGEAAREEDVGVDAAVGERVVVEGGFEVRAVRRAVGAVEREKTREQEQLTREKEPHAEAQRRALAFEGRELFSWGTRGHGFAPPRDRKRTDRDR